jgi:thioredoxin 2
MEAGMAEAVKLCCAACGQMNRVPVARLAAGPKCGICGAALVDGRVHELDAAAHDKAVRGDELQIGRAHV